MFADLSIDRFRQRNPRPNCQRSFHSRSGTRQNPPSTISRFHASTREVRSTLSQRRTTRRSGPLICDL